MTAPTPATPADVLAGRAEWCAVQGDGFALAFGAVE
jgi:hypothetical protein